MPYTQECAIIVACHHIMNMHDGNQQLPFPSCWPAFYNLAIPISCYVSNVFITCIISDINRIKRQLVNMNVTNEISTGDNIIRVLFNKIILIRRVKTSKSVDRSRRLQKTMSVQTTI